MFMKVAQSIPHGLFCLLAAVLRQCLGSCSSPIEVRIIQACNEYRLDLAPMLHFCDSPQRICHACGRRLLLQPLDAVVDIDSQEIHGKSVLGDAVPTTTCALENTFHSRQDLLC